MSQNKKIVRLLYSFFTAEQSKYVYFLLTASASSIGFWIYITIDLTLSIEDLNFMHFFLFCPVLLWLLSIFCGIKNRLYVISTTYSHMEALLMLEGDHDQAYANQENNIAAYKGIMEAAKQNITKITIYSKSQYWTFCFGIVFFSIWHIFQIFS